MRRTALRRKTPLKQQSARSKPSSPSVQESEFEAELNRMRPLVHERSKGFCEARIMMVCTGRANHVHHRKRRGPGCSNDLDSLLDVCFKCHDWIHGHVGKSLEVGLLVKRTSDPIKIPIDRQAIRYLSLNL